MMFIMASHLLVKLRMCMPLYLNVYTDSEVGESEPGDLTFV